MKKELLDENILKAATLIKSNFLTEDYDNRELNENIGRFNKGITGDYLNPNFKFDEITPTQRDGKQCLFAYTDYTWPTPDDKVFLYPSEDGSGEGTCEDWQGGELRKTYKWTTCTDGEKQFNSKGQVLQDGQVVANWATSDEVHEEPEEPEDREDDQTPEGREGGEYKDGADLTFCGSWSNALGFAVAKGLKYFKYGDEVYSTRKLRNVSVADNEDGSEQETPAPEKEKEKEKEKEEQGTQQTPEQPIPFDPKNLSEYGRELYAIYGGDTNRSGLQMAYGNKISKDPRYLALSDDEKEWIARNIFGVSSISGKRTRSDVSGKMISDDELSQIHQNAQTTVDDKMRPIVRKYAAMIKAKKDGDWIGKGMKFDEISRKPEFQDFTEEEKQYLAQLAGKRWYKDANKGKGKARRARNPKTERHYQGQQKIDYANSADSDSAINSYQQQQQAAQQQAAAEQPQQDALSDEEKQQVAEARLRKKINRIINEMLNN